MSKSKNSMKKCCSTEKQKLLDDIRDCDMCSTNWHDHHRCLSRAAKRSGRRARACIVS